MPSSMRRKARVQGMWISGAGLPFLRALLCRSSMWLPLYADRQAEEVALAPSCVQRQDQRTLHLERHPHEGGDVLWQPDNLTSAAL